MLKAIATPTAMTSDVTQPNSGAPSVAYKTIRLAAPKTAQPSPVATCIIAIGANVTSRTLSDVLWCRAEQGVAS